MPSSPRPNHSAPYSYARCLQRLTNPGDDLTSVLRVSTGGNGMTAAGIDLEEQVRAADIGL